MEKGVALRDCGCTHNFMKYEDMFNILCSEVEEANQKWWVDLSTGQPKDRNFGEMLMLVVSELAEALEGHRKNLPDDKLPQYPMHIVELIDNVIRAQDILAHECNKYNLSPGEVWMAKMYYNSIREDHKPENRLKPGGKAY